MTKRTRLTILTLCILLFLVVTPFILLYSLGYRIDLKEGTIVATGGIYVRAVPLDAAILIDNKVESNPGIFSNTVFVQNLLPAPHEVLVRKDGYHEYRKMLEVTHKEVTKLENVLLFKQNIPFSTIKETTDYFSTAPDNTTLLTATITRQGVTQTRDIVFEVTNLTNNQTQIATLTGPYPQISDVTWANNSQKALLHLTTTYALLDTTVTPVTIALLPALANTAQASFNPQDVAEVLFVKSAATNKHLYSTKTTLPLVENVVAYVTTSDALVYLSSDGFLYTANLQGQNIQKLSAGAIMIKKNSQYEMENVAGRLFLKENTSWSEYNPDKDIFEPFYSPIKEMEVSPNGGKLLYYNDHEVWYMVEGSPEKILLQRFSETISDAHWVNDDYIAINANGEIIISEIDVRGDINIFSLPAAMQIGDTTVEVKSPTIFFNQRDKRLYILTQNMLIASERLTP